MMTFVEACIKGKAKPEDIDDWTEKWRKGNYKQPIHSWLGLTLTEYAEWLGNLASAKQIIRKAEKRKSQQ